MDRQRPPLASPLFTRNQCPRATQYTGNHMANVYSRIKRYRARQRRGEIVIPIAVDEVLMTQRLVDEGFLAPDRIEDRAAIKTAATKLVRTLLEQSL